MHFYETSFFILLMGLFLTKNLRVKIGNCGLLCKFSHIPYNDVVFCLLVAAAVSLFYDLHPLMNNMRAEADSAVFLYIGKMMHNNLVPYKDLFDHKGIILYFIEYIGLALFPDSYSGVWILEAVGMFVTVVYLLKIGKLFSSNKKTLYLSTIAVLIVCGYKLYGGGNLVEEYALPWITAALYIFLKFIQCQKYEKIEIVLLGVGLSIILFLRVNMIGVWLVFLPYVFVTMIYHRKWKDLFTCTSLFFLGSMLVFLPVVLYLLYTDSFKAMVSYYIKFNLDYTKADGTLFNFINVACSFIRSLWPSVVAFCVSGIFSRKNKAYILNLILGLVSLGLVAMSGRLYPHYGMVLLPAFMVPFIIAIERLLDKKTERVTGIICIYIFLFVCSGYQIKQNNSLLQRTMEETHKNCIIQYLQKNTSQQQDVLIINGGIKNYLIADRYTKNKFFYQIPPISLSSDLCQEFVEELYKSTPDIILFVGEKSDIIEGNNALGMVCQELEKICQDQKMLCEVYSDYFVYKQPDS